MWSGAAMRAKWDSKLLKTLLNPRNERSSVLIIGGFNSLIASVVLDATFSLRGQITWKGKTIVPVKKLHVFNFRVAPEFCAAARFSSHVQFGCTVRAKKERYCWDISGRIAIVLVTGWNPCRVERFIANSLARKHSNETVQSMIGRECRFIPVGLFGLYLPRLIVDAQAGKNCRLLEVVNKIIHPRYWVWVTFADGVWFHSHRKGVEEVRSFLIQILSVQLILSGQVWWSFATAFCGALLFQSFGIWLCPVGYRVDRLSYLRR